jgi:hypothetical protein
VSCKPWHTQWSISGISTRANLLVIHSPGGLGNRDLDLSCLETGNIKKKLKELAQNGSFYLPKCSIEPLTPWMKNLRYGSALLCSISFSPWGRIGGSLFVMRSLTSWIVLKLRSRPSAKFP